MASQIGWVDFSPRHRDRVKKFMDMMGMGGVADELGVGMIRDAMSNKVFPGFSTLYTRAKYFLITPYILNDWEKASASSKSGYQYFRKAEKATNELIIRFYAEHPERNGESYFGKVKKEGNLKRQPSEIYRNGMNRLHLIAGDSTLDQLLLNRPSAVEELLSNDRGDDTTREQGEYRVGNLCGVPYAPDWQHYMTIHGLTLSRIEAELLRDRLVKYTPDSLPAALVKSSSLWSKYQKASAEDGGEDGLNNPMLYFTEQALGDIEREELRRHLMMAHDLSLFLFGIHIAYNLQLRKRIGNDDMADKLRKRGSLWFKMLPSRMLDRERFDINACMVGTNVKGPTRHFLNEVHKLIFSSATWEEAEDELCGLAERQERWNKNKKSRFLKIDKGQEPQDIRDRKWLGLSLINYRYHSTLSIVKDIYDGLNNTDSL